MLHSLCEVKASRIAACIPSCSILPPLIKQMRSDIFIASSWSCVTKMIVVPTEVAPSV